MLPLERYALIELGVGERAGRARDGVEERLDLLLAPLPRHGGVDGEHAQRRPFRPADRHAEEGGVTGLKHRVEAAEAPIVARLRERDRGS